MSCARPIRCWGNHPGYWGFPPRGLTTGPPQSKMLPRRTRQGESDPDGPANHRRRALGLDRRRSVESLVKPPRRVRGGPRPRWSPRGTAGRPQAQRCRGRKGSERLKGRSGVDRTKHQLGPGRTRLRRRRRATEAEGCGTGTVCRAHLVLRAPSGAGRNGGAGSRRGSVVELGSGSGTDGSPGDRVRVSPPGAAPRVRNV